MISVAPIPEHYEKLTPIAERLYQHMDHIAHLALLPLFLLSVLMAYSQDLGIQGAVVSRLKRLVVTAILLVAFPSLTGLIKNLGQEIALSIDNLQGIDEFLKAASEKANSYSASVKSLLDFGNDLLISFFVSASFVFLFFARFLLVAFYHFYWMILLVTGPLLILGNLFESTSILTRNLFKNLILVACWPIVWSILSAFLKGLPFIDAYGLEGGYTTVVVMNLILAVSLLFSPFMLSQFCEGTIVGAGSGVYMGARAVASMVASKATMGLSLAAEKVYPIAKGYMPNRESVFKAASKIKKPGSFVFLFLLASGGLFAEQSSINIRPGLSTVLCFEKAIDYIAIGDSRFFQAQKLGKNLLLKSTSANKETNLLVFVSNNLSDTFQLKSNLILPHNESVNCDSKPKTASILRPAEQILSSAVSKSGLRAELLRKAWESPKRDYFTIRIRLVNGSSKFWNPGWAKIQLKQGTNEFSHSGLSSERKDIPPGAKIVFDVQFTRPEISKNRGFIDIPSPQGTLTLLVEKGASK